MSSTSRFIYLISLQPKPFMFPTLFHALPIVFHHNNMNKKENINKEYLQTKEEKMIFDAIDSIQPDYVDTTCQMVVCRPSPFNICFCYDVFQNLTGARRFFGI